MTEIDGATFKAEVRAAGQQLSPARAGLLFAREVAYPSLRPSDYLIQLDDMAQAAHRALQVYTTLETRGLALAEYLFHTLGFRGDSTDYTNPRNSYLNDVLERRTGLPISLSVVYLALGERLRLPVGGVGMPGHFIVALECASGPLYLDPFHGGMTLTVQDCARLVSRSTGYPGAFEPRWLLPTPPREIVARMLNNLRNFYLQAEDWRLAIAVIERLCELEPNVAAHLRDLGLLHYRNGALHKAERLLDQYIAREPKAKDIDSVRRTRALLVEHLARLN